MYLYFNDAKQLAGMYTCSDYERKKNIYKIPIDKITEIFNLVGNDYLSGMSKIYDSKMDDYKITIL